MKQYFREIVTKALSELKNRGVVPMDLEVPVIIEYPDVKYGDYSTNVAFLIAKTLRRKPLEIADLIKGEVCSELLDSVEISGGGFINFRVKKDFWYYILQKILKEGDRYGELNLGDGKSINIEFVSANPTGPLHVGHGRGAVVGDSLARILEKAGYRVTREYYINDAGRQVELLGESILARMFELLGENYPFPEDGYKGEYVYELARIALNDMPDVLRIQKKEAVEKLSLWAVSRIMEWIKKDLTELGISFDIYFSERKLHEGDIQNTIEELRKAGYTYEKDGALWFKSTLFGDEKDRVLVRADGSYTYFAADVAYHRNKFLRGYDLYINVWGADHHGYIKRVKGALRALGFDDNKLEILLIQMVNLIKDGKPVTMSKREGEIVTLRWLLDEVGKDAVRFIFLTRKQDAHLDFDIGLATRQTEENPVFYVQYAHARICSIYRTAKDRNIDIDITKNEINYGLLNQEEEIEILRKLAMFPDTIEACAKNYEPHRMTFYLVDLASSFHRYYNKFRILEDNRELRIARVALCEGVRRVIKEGLKLIGIEAVEVM